MKKILLLTLCGAVSCFGMESGQQRQMRFLTPPTVVPYSEIKLLVGPNDTFLPFTPEEFDNFMKKLQSDLAAAPKDFRPGFGIRLTIFANARREIERKRAEYVHKATDSFPAGHAVVRIIDLSNPDNQ